MPNPGTRLSYYERLVLKIKDEVVQGVLSPGDKLLSVRDMSVREHLNPNTVVKAYKQLEQDGIIHVEPGRGTFVSETPSRPDESSVSDIKSQFEQLLLEAKSVGIDLHIFEQWLSSSLERYEDYDSRNQ